MTHDLNMCHRCNTAATTKNTTAHQIYAAWFETITMFSSDYDVSVAPAYDLSFGISLTNSDTFIPMHKSPITSTQH
jgi:hypothetical protein